MAAQRHRAPTASDRPFSPDAPIAAHAEDQGSGRIAAVLSRPEVLSMRCDYHGGFPYGIRG